MPYKCTQCGAIYMDGSEELQEVVKRGGCACGKKLLMYVRAPVEEIEEDIKREIEKRTGKTGEKPVEKKEKELVEKKDKKPVEKKEPVKEKKEHGKSKRNSDIEWLDREFTDREKEDKPVYFDVETVQRIDEGKFKLDVGSLMSGKPYVVKAEEGVYYIHVPSAMKKKTKKEKEE